MTKNKRWVRGNPLLGNFFQFSLDCYWLKFLFIAGKKKKKIRVDDCKKLTDKSMTISIDSTKPAATDDNSFPSIDT